MAICALSIACPFRASASYDHFSSGDRWYYEVTDSYQDITMVGWWEIRYVGLTTKTVGNITYDAYRFESDARLTYSKPLQAPTLSDPYLTRSLVAYSFIIESRLLEVNTLDTVLYEHNESLSSGTLTQYSFTPWGESDYEISYSGWRHNVTTYSPPGGMGAEPSTVGVGAAWTKSHNISYQYSECNNDWISSRSGTATVNESFEVVAREGITVPAGTFDCFVIRQTSPEGNTTSWVSEKVGAEVKIETVSTSSENTTAVLSSYSYEPPGENNDLSLIYLATSITIAAATAVTVLALYLWNRTRIKIRIR